MSYAMIDKDDMPPRKRPSLPTREQIEAITDIPALVEIEQEVERRAEKITVDLEMQVGDDDWDARARSALTAHRICLKSIRKRLNRLRGVNKPPQVEADTARMERKVQKATALATVKSSEAERARAKADQQHALAVRDQLALLKRTSFHMHFHNVARRILTAEQFEEIEAHARVAALSAATLIEPQPESDAA